MRPMPIIIPGITPPMKSVVVEHPIVTANIIIGILGGMTGPIVDPEASSVAEYSAP